jgi:hypothetical protein
MSAPHPLRPEVDAAAKAVDALGVAFDDEGPYSSEMTTTALTALGTRVTYLGVCLGCAQPAAIPDAATLATVVLTLHATCAQLRAGLHATRRAIDRRQLPADPAELDITRIAAMRASLSGACDALLCAADELAAAHHAATDA